MTPDERKRTTEAIHHTAHRLDEIARRFNRLAFMADNSQAEEAFVSLVDSVGMLVRGDLQRMDTILDIVWNVGRVDEEKKIEYPGS